SAEPVPGSQVLGLPGAMRALRPRYPADHHRSRDGLPFRPRSLSGSGGDSRPGEFRHAARPGRNREAEPVQLDDGIDQAQPEAHARIAATLVRAVEPPPDLLALLRGDARAGV